MSQLLTTRVARLSDQDQIESLIERSVRQLAISYYSEAQIEAALLSAWGLDTQLIKDKSYFLIHKGDALIGCGGWSYRKTLFGNDNESKRDPELLDPQTDAAKIRAYFVSPEFARMGVASIIMNTCEQAAIQAGFKKLELMSTLPGLPFYKKFGFREGQPIQYALSDGLSIEFVPMTKTLSI